MQKRVEVDKNRVVYYFSNEDNPKTIQIREVYSDKVGVIKSYIFTMCKNYEISGYTINNNTTDLFFEFDNNHPLYLSFLDYLLDDGDLIIDDDRVKENNRKYVKVYKNGNKIILQFVNNLTNDKNKLSYKKFNVLVKNNHSKVDQKGLNTKERLYDFFNDVNSLMLGEELEESKTYVKKRTSLY